LLVLIVVCLMKLLIALGTFVGFATAACPNSCSGHGTCNIYDACTCFKETALELMPKPAPAPIDITADGYKWDPKTSPAHYQIKFLGASIEVEWTGADCSRRTCPRGISWSMSCVGAACTSTQSQCEHQIERECSDQGICDRATGLCSCFPGYTGASCQRTDCPNDCSGHGSCRSNRDFAYDWAVAKTKQIMDKSTQNIQNKFEGVYVASYDDAWDSDKHWGCKCDQGYRGPSCALVECPSSTDPLDDKCTGEESTHTITDYQLQYDVPFGAAGWEAAYSAKTANTDFNDQYKLDPATGRKVYGCYGAMSGQDCSGRGICDYSSGTCKCFSGYSGTACESVDTMA